MSDIKSSIQVIIFGKRNATDLPGVLRDISASGYDAFETGNLLDHRSESEVRLLLEENKLSISGIHLGYGDYANEKRVGEHIAFCKKFNVKNMMCSGVSDPTTITGYEETALLFDKVGARLRDEGIAFNYHNHNWEFNDLGGVNGMQILATQTNPALVKFNIDVFWVTMGKEDPANFIKMHASRAGYFHFKDGYQKDDGSFVFTELGKGKIDLRGAMRAALEVGIQWMVYEQDHTDGDPTQSAAISRDYMRDILGV